MTYARNHTPEIGDEEILRMMNLAVLVFTADGKELKKWHFGKSKYVSLVITPHGEARRNKVNIRLGTTGKGRARTIYLNKLVWMWHHRQVVPEGFVIDHVDEDCTNDDPNNLKLMSYEDSDRQGWELQGKNGEDEIPF
ncbi:HNH endonuclease [Candidatus Pacearchaeota archaeon]|jgi:hypothetical protein|nr:HNH endonuclease [Candidatus Pacearchaeota archaeon]